MGPVRVEKLIFGGQGLAHDNGKTVFLWNALPGEVVEYEVLKKRKGIIEAVATKILEPSPDRIAPEESHYISCSPWEVLARPAEDNSKQQIALETYRRLGKQEISAEELPIISSGPDYGYRNKIEFSFWTDPVTAHLSLAFFNRGTHRLVTLPTGCALGSQAINKTAEKIRAWLEQEGVHGKVAKSVIVRSNEKGETLAAVFLKQEINFKNYPAVADVFKGLQIYYSNPLSPASTPDKLLYSAGDNFLISTICGRQFKFGALSFFQINIPLFEEALKDIIESIPQNSRVIDYYSGVGVIGLLAALTKKCEVTLVEINPEAHEYALQNIAANNSQATAILAPSEKALEYVEADATIVVDPPRAGLHPDFVERLLAVQPKRIVYLSCDLATEARDVALLAGAYVPVFQRIYNFFPRTPHVEALWVLEKKERPALPRALK